MKIAVLVPYRSDGGHRDRLWEYLQRTYWASTGFTIIEGESPEGSFNRSAAVNDAARKAGDFDVAVIADNDTWVPTAQLNYAIEVSRSHGVLASALSSVVELSPECTDAILTGKPLFENFGVDQVRTEPLATQSSVLAISRDLWEHIGGFDESFVGWGGEDNAFWRAATILGGTPIRHRGAAFHLWHEPAAPRSQRINDRAYLKNLARWKQYARASSVAQIRRAQNA